MCNFSKQKEVIKKKCKEKKKWKGPRSFLGKMLCSRIFNTSQLWLDLLVGVRVPVCAASVKRKINKATTPGRHVGKIRQELRNSSEIQKPTKKSERATRNFFKINQWQ